MEGEVFIGDFFSGSNDGCFRTGGGGNEIPSGAVTICSLLCVSFFEIEKLRSG